MENHQGDEQTKKDNGKVKASVTEKQVQKWSVNLYIVEQALKEKDSKKISDCIKILQDTDKELRSEFGVRLTERDKELVANFYN